jgi:hypothetical protein
VEVSSGQRAARRDGRAESARHETRGSPRHRPPEPVRQAAAIVHGNLTAKAKPIRYGPRPRALHAVTSSLPGGHHHRSAGSGLHSTPSRSSRAMCGPGPADTADNMPSRYPTISLRRLNIPQCGMCGRDPPASRSERTRRPPGFLSFLHNSHAVDNVSIVDVAKGLLPGRTARPLPFTYPPERLPFSTGRVGTGFALPGAGAFPVAGVRLLLPDHLLQAHRPAPGGAPRHGAGWRLAARHCRLAGLGAAPLVGAVSATGRVAHARRMRRSARRAHAAVP